jgi:hypothetical protein
MFELAGAHVVLRCSEDPAQMSRWLQEDIATVFSSRYESVNTYILKQQIHPIYIRARCLVVNLWRDFEDHRGGHVSPLAAYHPQRQMVLLLDVARCVATTELPTHNTLMTLLLLPQPPHAAALDFCP